MYVPLMIEKVARRSDVGSMRPRPPLVFAEDIDSYGERCRYNEYYAF